MPSRAIIIGSGIGGAALANLLARGGWNITILEKNLVPVRVERPEVLWPATLRLLESILGREKLLQGIVPFRGIRFYRSRRPLLSFDVPSVSVHALDRAASTDPNETRRLLLEAGTFVVRRGVEFAGLLREGDRVVGALARNVQSGATVELDADWIIGDDGSHSAVRAACGIACDIHMIPIDLLCFGVQWPDAFPPGVPHLFLNQWWKESGIFLMGAAPFPGGRGAGLIPTRPRALEDRDRAARDFDRFLARNPGARTLFADRRFPEDVFRVRTGYGHAERYGIPGVFLLGDAAHPVTPAGGQGANLSVNDAASLAELLLGAHPRPLEEYERQRRPAAERSLRLSRGAARALRIPDAVISRLAPLAFQLIGLQPRLFSPVVRLASTAFVSASQGE